MSMNTFDFGYQFAAYDGVSPTLAQMNKGMDQLEQNSKEAGAATQKAFFDMETSAKVASHAMQAFETMKGMKTDFSDFEAGIAEASTLVKGSGVDMEEYSEKLLQYSKKYGEMPAALTKSLYTAMSSGFISAAESSVVLEQSMKLAVGGVTTAAEAMDGMTTIMHSWGMSTAEVQRISDSLFVAMRAGKTTIGELSREIGQVSALADLGGVSIEELTAAAAALTLGGRTTSEAFNGLRSILTEVLRQEPGVVKEIEKLGADFSLQSLRTKGLTRFMMDLQDAVLKSGDESRWAKVFGRVQGLGSAISITGKQAGKFAEILADMGNKAGSTDDAVNKMMNTSKMQAKQYEASVMVMRIRMGQALSPLFTIWRKIKLAVVEAITVVAEKAPWLIKIVGALLLVGAAFVLVIAKIAALKALWVLVSVFAKAAIAAMAGGLAALGPVIGIVAAAVAALIGTILLLKKAYEENWSGFADWVDHATQSVYAFYDALRQLWTTGEITGPTAEFLMMNQAVWDVTQAVWYLVEAVKFLFGGIADGFGNISDLLEPFKGQFEIVSQMFKQLGKIWEETANTFATSSSDPITLMTILWGLGYAIGKIFKFALLIISSAVASIVAVVGAAFAVVYSAFMLVWRIIHGLYTLMSGDFQNGIKEIGSAILQFFASIVVVIAKLADAVLFSIFAMFGVTREQYEEFFTAIGQAFTDFWAFLVSGFRAAQGGIETSIAWIGEVFSAVINGIVIAWDAMIFALDFGMSWFTDGIRSGLTFVGNAFEAIANFVKKVWDAIFKWFEEKLGWLKDSVDWIADAASTISGAAGAAIDAAGGALKSTGRAIGGIFGIGGGSVEKAQPFSMVPLLPQAAESAQISAAAPSVARSAETSPGVAASASQLGAFANLFGMGFAETMKVSAQFPPVSVSMDGRVVAQLVSERLKESNEASLTTVLPTLASGGK